NLLLAFAAVCALGANAQTFSVSGINYNILDEDAATVEIAPGDYSKLTVTLTETVTDEATGKTYTVIGLGNEAFKNTSFKVPGTGVFWLPATITNIGIDALNGFTNYAANPEMPGTYFCGMRGVITNLDPKAVRGNKLNKFNLSKGGRYCAMSELDGHHSGLIITADKDTLVNYPGMHRTGTNDTYGIITGYNMLESIKHVGDYAFWKNENLTRVGLPEGLLSIGEEAFYGSVLKEFNLPTTVEKLGDGFLAGAIVLTDITVTVGNENFTAIDGNLYTIDGKTLVVAPGGKDSVGVADGVTTIGKFAGREGRYTQVVLPATTTELLEGAFAGSKLLTSVTVKATVPPTGGTEFAEAAYNNATLYVPKGCVATYQAAEGWKEFSSIEEIQDDKPQGLKGDLNEDTLVDIADLNILINMILGGTQSTSADDLNEDTLIDIADLNALINIILGIE
ncbi:MAG: leucine-rich repeat protein, partial [Bacteroidales bacterium]|nr:leucine-rich repeat protein [Candidatus Sodaliphilus aphodohippi]